jgi:hypothetical protein
MMVFLACFVSRDARPPFVQIRSAVGNPLKIPVVNGKSLQDQNQDRVVWQIERGSLAIIGATLDTSKYWLDKEISVQTVLRFPPSSPTGTDRISKTGRGRQPKRICRGSAPQAWSAATSLPCSPVCGAKQSAA